VRAKTGTLSGVNTLAGEVVDRSGRLLVFAFLAPHAPSAGLTEAALDSLAARLVRCGCGVAS
jgi:D-alanyl-D-alanine carboxypeptidase/D-alanyl-D-alanine-endopeptidase (penicillin-binding protein 4)